VAPFSALRLASSKKGFVVTEGKKQELKYNVPGIPKLKEAILKLIPPL